MRKSSNVRKTIFPGLCLLLFLPIANACAQPLRFICDQPQGKRLDLTGTDKQVPATPAWTDDVLQGVHPAVTVDGEILTVTWGSTVAGPAKGTPKPTTFVFASAYRNDQSILATRVDRNGAEIFRFYFGSKRLVRLASTSTAASDTAAPATNAILIADCRDQ
jgi:hypothetical protein